MAALRIASPLPSATPLWATRRTTMALEINLSGPTLEAGCSLACVLWGANFELFRNERALRSGYTFNLEPGDLVRIGGCSQGARAYFCVRSGFDAPLILASRSALTPLQASDSLACRPGSTKGRTVHGPWIWNREPSVLRVLEGSQAAWFSKKEFLEHSFTVASASNRMGLRLMGRPLTQTPTEIVSEPVCPGTVQVTRDGQCIVLGVDGQTIGGYPKIAQVITPTSTSWVNCERGTRFAFAKFRSRKRNVFIDKSGWRCINGWFVLKQRAKHVAIALHDSTGSVKSFPFLDETVCAV